MLGRIPRYIAIYLTIPELSEYKQLLRDQKKKLENLKPYLQTLEELSKEKGETLQPTRTDKTYDQLYEFLDTYKKETGTRLKELTKIAFERYSDSCAPGKDKVKNEQKKQRLIDDAKDILNSLTYKGYEDYARTHNSIDIEKILESSLSKEEVEQYKNDPDPEHKRGFEAGIKGVMTVFSFVLSSINVNRLIAKRYKYKDVLEELEKAQDPVLSSLFGTLIKRNVKSLHITPDKVEDISKVFDLPTKAQAIADSEAAEQYGKILQNSGLNTLTKIDTQKIKVDYNPISKIGTVTKGDFTLSMKNFTDIEGFTATTHQLLDTLFLQYCQTKTDERGFVNLPLKTYMNLRGLRNEKTAREQVNNDLETLFNASISFTDKKVKQTYTDSKGQTKTTRKTRNYLDVRIIQEKGIRNGIISVMFSDRFNKEVLPNLHLMDYPKELLKIETKYRPNSFYFGRKIAELKRMNAGNKNEDLISVKTLLESCPTIPTYEEVKSNDRHFDRKIITPFARDMDNLSSIFSWHFCHTNGELLTNEELENFDYNLFITLLVKIKWLNYPDQTERISKKRKKAKV